MRPFSAIAAALLLASMVPAASHAATPSAAAAVGQPAAPNCGCAPPHRVWHRRVVRHVWRHRRPLHLVAAPPPPPPYNPLLPSPLDSAYDRGMTLHFRAPPVSGIRLAEPGYPPTPPIAGVIPYRVPAYAGVYQYDGLTGSYVRLAQTDALRSGLLIPPPPPPPPPPLAVPPVRG